MATDNQISLFEMESDSAPVSKRCSKCRKFLPIELFSFARKARGERHTACRDCLRPAWKRNREMRKKNGKDSAYNRGRRGRLREQMLQKKYGVTLPEYERMLLAQGGVCAICHRSEFRNGKGKARLSLAVDHCHKTGKIRGLLCVSCNRAIGLLADSIEFLQNAIAYLRAN